MQFQIYLEAIKKSLQNEMFLKKENFFNIDSSPNITSEELNFFMEYLANAMEKKGIKNIDEALKEYLDKKSDFYKNYNNKDFSDILDKFKQNGYVKEKKDKNMYFYFLKNNILYYLSIKHYLYGRDNIIIKVIAFSIISTIRSLKNKEGSMSRKSTPDSSNLFNMIFSIIKKEIPEYEKIIFSFDGIPEFKEMERIEKGQKTMRTRLYVAVLKGYFGKDIEINQSGSNIYFSKQPIPIGKPLKESKSRVISR